METQSAPHFSRDRVDLIKRTIAKGATDDELAFFLEYCERTGLDPIARQIYLSERRSQRNGEWIVTRTPEVTIDGFRVIAERSGKYLGQVGPFWCAKDGNWKDVWLGDEPPAAAKVGVLVAGFREPLYAIALYREYVQVTRDGQPNTMWKKMPASQLAKCAESLALRKALPRKMSGLYTREEMEQSTNEALPAPGAPALIEGEVVSSPQTIGAHYTATTTVSLPAETKTTTATGNGRGESHTNGHAASPAPSGILFPPELAKVLNSYTQRAFPNADKRKGVQGVVTGKLDDYAGDTDRRHTFLLALFGKKSMTELTDGQIMALDAWKDHPRAESEVNRVIADYLKSQGQQELFTETPAPAPVPPEVANFNVGSGVTIPSKKTMPPAVPLCTQAQRDELKRLFAAASEGDVDEGEKVLSFRVKQQFGVNSLYELAAADANILIADMQAQTESVPF